MPWLRIFSGIVAIALAMGMILLGGWYFTIGFCVIVYLGQLELFQLVKAKGMVPATKSTMFVSQLLLITATISPTLADAVFPIAGTFICFYLLFQPKIATIADIGASILGLLYGGYLPGYWVRLRVGLTETSSLARDATVAATNLPSSGYWSNFSINLSHLPAGLSTTLLAFSCI
ncbi:MAG: phosphatidate cytidylyltransferase, partial [Moorea sp. SIO4G2]|nr:phosphatidate cytidylyltransferase [Moorena sp. SIO4G2]